MKKINTKYKDQVLHGKSVKDLDIRSLHDDLIKRFIFLLEQDISVLKNELFRREHNLLGNEHENDLFDEFGLPNVDTKEGN